MIIHMTVHHDNTHDCVLSCCILRIFIAKRGRLSKTKYGELVSSILVLQTENDTIILIIYARGRWLLLLFIIVYNNVERKTVLTWLFFSWLGYDHNNTCWKSESGISMAVWWLSLCWPDQMLSSNNHVLAWTASCCRPKCFEWALVHVLFPWQRNFSHSNEKEIRIRFTDVLTAAILIHEFR